jgi:beta-glucosidase
VSVRFPEGFLWGTATSAHQVEGANYNSDWWEWEHDPTSPCTEPSGDACDHYHRYPDDLAILQDLGFNCYRFSIEWARIEPEEGEFSRAQLDHYRRVVAACRENGLLPIVTLHHFTSPRWVARAGGWAHPDAPDRFARYCQRAGAHLGDLIGVACTINEPNIVALMGYLTGIFPPGERDAEARERVTENFIAAHRMAVETLREHTDAPVGLTLAMSEYHAVDGADENMHRLREPMEDVFLDAVRDDDFIGVQTYSRTRVGPQGVLPPENPGSTQMFYDFYPHALEHTVRRAWDMTEGTPIIVTENGIATDDDDLRIAFVAEALRGLHRCISDGIDARGYVYWSLLDNFEWALGYTPTFGLVAVDRSTQERAPKPSAGRLGEIARANALDWAPR